MVPISITFFAWSVLTISNTEKRVSIIESNRYTPATALQFERATQQKFDLLATSTANNAAQLEVIRTIVMRIESELEKNK